MSITPGPQSESSNEMSFPFAQPCSNRAAYSLFPSYFGRFPRIFFSRAPAGNIMQGAAEFQFTSRFLPAPLAGRGI